MSTRKSVSWIGIAALGPLLIACQGAADYSAVNLEKKKAVLRTDQFQGAGSRVAVAVASICDFCEIRFANWIRFLVIFLNLTRPP